MTSKVKRVRVAAAGGAVVLGLLPVAVAHADTTPTNTYTPYRVTGLATGEPSIGFDPIRNVAVYGAGTGNKRLAFDDTTSPATLTITDAKAPTSATSLDAITFIDQKTGRLFVSQLAGATSLFSYSDSAGVPSSSYMPSSGAGAGTLLDHQTVGAGPFHAPAPVGASYPDAVYYCAQDSFNGNCAVSTNGSTTFGAGVPAYNSAANDANDPNPTFAAAGGACSALHGHLRVGPDGTAYLPLKGCGGDATAGNLTNTEFAGGHPSVSVSTDNGTSWLIHRIDAGKNSDESDPSVAVGRGDKIAGKGRVFLGWEDGVNLPDSTGYGVTSAAKIATSTDDGKTFSTPVDVSTPLGIKNVQFPEVIAGDDDRAAFAWLGTTTAGDDQHNPGTTTGGIAAIPATAVWHLYVSTTYDGGQTYMTVDTTPVAPVQRGCIDLQGTSNKTATDNNICSTRNLLDFNDITVDKQGRALVAYAQGCTGTCLTNPTAASNASDNFVMRQSTGMGLYAANDAQMGGAGPSPVVPEAPFPALLAVAAAAGAAVVIGRRRRLAARR